VRICKNLTDGVSVTAVSIVRRTPGPHGSSLSANPPIRPLVLLVEGHEDTRALYALALAANGFDVVAVQDGGEACTRA
jgi:hypothetical protein